MRQPWPAIIPGSVPSRCIICFGGSCTILFPNLFFHLIGALIPPLLPLWRCSGMLGPVFVPACFWAGRHQERHGHLIAFGQLAKVLGALCFVWAVATGQLPLVFGVINLTNDVLWWPSFGLYLRAIVRRCGGGGVPLWRDKHRLVVLRANLSDLDSFIIFGRTSMTDYSYLTHLACSRCGQAFEAERVHTVSPCCGKPLLARYDLEQARRTWDRSVLCQRPATMWRYHEVLPARHEAEVVSLGEGMTPLLPCARLSEALGYAGARVLVKDEGQNPTGSFKARGMSAAVSRARALGITALATPSAGNAAAALATYAARAGLPATVFMPRDAPTSAQAQVAASGAHLYLVNGLIDDAGALVAALKEERGWFDVATLKEPYRVEGKKTMGFELAEQLDWHLPDAIIYPAGGGTGIVGLWKAFEELEALGWIGSTRPKLILVQAEGCAPLVRALETGAETAERWQGAQTLAGGLRVPAAIGDFLILRAVRESNGRALTVSDAEMVEAARMLAATEGIVAGLEGAAPVAAYRKLLATGLLQPEEVVVLFNTGSGLLSLDAFPVQAPIIQPGEHPR
jgi:threonine synthase